MPAHRHAIGLTRRELIQVGYSGLLGMGLPSLLAKRRGRGGERAEGEIGRADLPDRRRRATSTPST